MIKSMTGFARAEAAKHDLSVTTEIRSYNSRHLDVNLRLAGGLEKLEAEVKAAVAKRRARGRVDIRLVVENRETGKCAFSVDRARAASYMDQLRRLSKSLGITDPVPLALVAQAPGVITVKETPLDPNAAKPVVMECLDAALDLLEAMCYREGEHLFSDMGKRICLIEDLLGQIAKEADGLADDCRSRLEERIRALTHGMVEMDPGRVAQEAAFLADKSDISEEVVRAESHIRQFREIMDGSGPAGQPLNFLLQEFLREFNTMGSKAGSSKISHLIVTAKSELEKIREQVLNVE